MAKITLYKVKNLKDNSEVNIDGITEFPEKLARGLAKKITDLTGDEHKATIYASDDDKEYLKKLKN